MPEQHSITLDDSAQASNPGSLRVNALRWCRHYPGKPLTWCGLLAASVALAIFVHWAFWVLAALVLHKTIRYCIVIQEHFKYGAVNPAVVVALRPTLVAVSTDLSKGEGRYPVIKIIRTRLSRAAGKIPQIGSRLVTVSIYSQAVDESIPHWLDCRPLPADCATADQDELDRLMSSVPAEEWRDLEIDLAEVPQPYRPGLYFIELVVDALPPLAQDPS